MKKCFLFWFFSLSLFAASTGSGLENSPLFQVKLKVKTQKMRDELAGIMPIDSVDGEFVSSTINSYDYKILKEKFPHLIIEEKMLETEKGFESSIDTFPSGFEGYHTYKQVEEEMDAISKINPDWFKKISLGKSLQGRELWGIRMSSASELEQKPAILIMALHHAREHLSTDVAIRLVQYIGGQKGEDWKKTLREREIIIVPMLNPDGAMFDISGGSFRSWRKNRSMNRGGSNGVDLNRNYGFQWGTGGSSADESSDVYMGPNPFSEPETQAVKKFVESHPNIKVMLTLHTFSELILYPWGHKHGGVGGKDEQVFDKMAKTMAATNGYTPEHSSDLYIASGDTCDWAYGEHQIFCFTFELYPKRYDIFTGFYPRPKHIEPTFQKNLKAFEYLINYSDNPYRALE